MDLIESIKSIKMVNMLTCTLPIVLERKSYFNVRKMKTGIMSTCNLHVYVDIPLNFMCEIIMLFHLYIPRSH